MPRPWFWLALLIALSGTPLRLSEAASDLARSIEGPEDEGTIELVDGGIGDDWNETLRVERDLDLGAAGVSFDGLISHFSARDFRPRLGSTGPFGGPLARPLSSSARRLALLQRFLC